MSTGPDGKPELLSPEAARQVCPDQVQRTKFVDDEARRLGKRLERDKVALVFQVQVYAFNCGDKQNHPEGPHPYHVDYIAGGGAHWDVPGALPATIRALEHALAELKKRVQ